ncbi:MAG: type II secretion system GspH family protein [Candidatus Omnitrophica bacterium]|nr:type II secretion system GspH family protein [Candidatus Omnitrophota bacterium]
MRLLKERGINLIELVATLVVVGIAIPVLLSMWANISWRSAGSENVADATFYGQALMEEIKSKNFDNKTISPWTNSASLGFDIYTGENRDNATTFNDVDDYLNTTDINITTPAVGYIRSANIEYVYLDGANTWQACVLPITCGAVSTCANCDECCYKRITVNIRRSDGLLDNITLATIVAGN